MRTTRDGTPARSRGRRRALWGLSAAVAVVAGAAGILGAYGGGGHGGDYAAVGAAGQSAPGERSPGAGPTEGVRLVPLDDPTGSGADGAGIGIGDGAEGGSVARGTPGGSGKSVVEPPPSGTDSPAEVTHTPPQPSGSAPPTATPSPPSTAPAALVASDPVRTPTDHRWCEDVTLTFRNPGGRPVRSGTVTFGTHVIDALGIDWSTVESTEALPTPIAPGARKERTWTVCVDAWRVPLGMRIETRDVSVRWE